MYSPMLWLCRFQARGECLLWNRTVWGYIHMWRHKESNRLSVMWLCRWLCMVGFFSSNREDPPAICKGSLEWTSFLCWTTQPWRLVLQQGTGAHHWWHSWWSKGRGSTALLTSRPLMRSRPHSWSSSHVCVIATGLMIYHVRFNPCIDLGVNSGHCVEWRQGSVKIQWDPIIGITPNKNKFKIWTK